MTARGATLRALWNLRALGLFLVGPVAGLGLVAATFGLPPALLALAGGFLLFSLSLFGLLVRGERRRLCRAAPAG